MTIRVLVADDHPVVRAGLKSLLDTEPDIEVVAEVGDGSTAVQFVRDTPVDVAIVDVAMPELSGVEATKQILEVRPETSVIALSMHSDRRYVLQMLRAGARAYLVKDGAMDELVRAVRAVAAGQAFLSPGICRVVIDNILKAGPATAFEEPSVLSGREREVLQLLAEGNTTREIAASLKLSVKTIESHRSQIMRKLEIHSIAGLTKYAVRTGLTPLED